jgi:hypothetical protein
MKRICKECGVKYEYTLEIRDDTHPFYCKWCRTVPTNNKRKRKPKDKPKPEVENPRLFS